MHCERVRELLSPYLDEALPAQDRAMLAAHLEACQSCARVAADFRRFARTLTAVGRQTTPPSLLPRLRRALADRPPAATARPPRAPAWQRPPTPAAALWGAVPVLAACAVTAIATWWLFDLSQSEARFEHDVLAAHMRALLQETPTQVVSADTHSVKPWFNGRLDFSPGVSDLSAQGFTLLGARLDYVGDRRVGVLVYRRRNHSIDVFVWPTVGSKHRGDRVVVVKGYTLATWTRQGLTYWAISDLGADELKTLERLF